MATSGSSSISSRRLVLLEVDGAQRAPAADRDGAHELGSRLVGRVDLDLGAHPVEEAHQREAGRVDPDALERDLGVGVHGARNQPRRRSRRIAWHLELERPRAAQGRSATVTRPSRRIGTPVQSSIRSV